MSQIGEKRPLVSTRAGRGASAGTSFPFMGLLIQRRLRTAMLRGEPGFAATADTNLPPERRRRKG
jgi:hypothetical protein